MNEIVISGLLILLIGSTIFWGVITHKLINKLMSRNFYEYREAVAVPKKQQTELAQALSNVKIHENVGPNELDSLDQMIKGVLPLG